MLIATLIGPSSTPGSLILDHQAKATSSFVTRHADLIPGEPSRDRNVGSDGDELVWSGRRLIWSKGILLHRQYTFDQDGEDIAFALFAHFPTTATAGSKGKGVEVRLSDTLGPFQTSHTAKWGGPSTSASSSTTFSTSQRASTAPSLVVFLQTRAHVYSPSGEDICVQLPYVIDKAWALPGPDGGVMVQRVLDRWEKRKMARSESVLQGSGNARPSDRDRRKSALEQFDEREMDVDRSSQPRLAILMDPLEELKAVVEGTVVLDGDEHRLAYADDIDSDRSVLYSAQGDHPPHVILHSRASNQIIFTRRVTVPVPPTPLEPESPGLGLTPRTMRPSDILAPEPQPQPVPVPTAAPPPAGRPRPSLRRNPSSAFGADRRVSGMADPLDRAQRRAPRVSRALEATGPGELQRTLDIPSMPVPSAGMSKMVTRTEEKRRESGASAIMRDDLDTAGRAVRHIHHADDAEWRDTTMLMGVEREEAQRSDVVLDRIWAWTLPDGLDPSDLSIFLSDNLSPSSVVINILSPSLQQLYTFQATHHAAGDRWQISARTLIPSASAIPLLSTRPDVLDTLNLNPDGTLHIITSFNQSIALALPTWTEGDDVAHKLASSLRMTMETDDRMSSDSSLPEIVGLQMSKGSEFVVLLKSGEALRASANFTIKSGPAQAVMEALSYAWPLDAFFALKRQMLAEWASSKVGAEMEWETLARTLRRAFGLGRTEPPQTNVSRIVHQNLTSSDPLLARLAARCQRQAGDTHTSPPAEALPEPTFDPSLLAPALMALHLVGQDCRLSLNTRPHLNSVARVILDISAAVGRLDWWDYWMRISPCPNLKPGPKRYTVDTSILDVYQQPPDIISYLTRRLYRPTKPFPTPSTFFNHVSEFGTPEPCAQTQLICDLFNLIGLPERARQTPTDAINRAYAAAQLMVDRQLGVEWIADRPACIALPILETMKSCQMVPRPNASSGVYELIGRLDLEMQRRGGQDLAHQPEQDTTESMPSVGDLMRGTIKRSEPLGLPHVRFGADRRLREVERIMQASRIRSINLETKAASDAEIAQYQQAMVNTIAQRTLAVLVGQGIFEYGTRNTAITDIWEVPLIELSVKLSPSNTLLKAQIHGEHVDWPCFHNGVSAGLSISSDCKGIDSAWIVLNKPTPLNPEHGGFLLGLGLTGHLRKLKTYHAFPYMEARHDFTSVGLLLGLASSYAGSEDILITKTLSLHTHALLPLGSMALNASPIVQSSALVGLGLVYAGSKNLRMAEVTLSEVGRKEMAGIDNFSDYQEAYSFSAAAAFGLIMLARGGQAASEVDRRMLGRLRRCIHGDGPDLRKGLIPIDTTITGAGATLALGLMYLKSNRTDIRDILEIPSTALALDLIRPDLLLLRTFARGLIMWDSITPALTWIEDQLPPFILTQVKGHKFVGGLELATDLAYINIIAGACLAIGLKFAGTASEMAHNNLMLLYHVLYRSAGSGSMAYEGKIRRSAARQGLNIVSIAICCVMSGTGELQVLRRLRISHGQEGVGVTYGTHMAMHMAVGLLFLGKGQFTLGTSNLAIAAMSIAFFPRFMHTPDDNRAYPQAFRHLWALAAEPRCLMARDVDTGETVYLPIKVKLQEGKTIRSQNLISPTLIAPFESLVSIEVDSPRYWPITYTFTDPIHRAALVRTRTIHVKRRAGHQDYNSDPKGNRSIFIRAGGVTGFDLHYDLLSPAAPPTIPSDEALELIRQHSPISYHSVLAGLMGGETGYERFIRTVLLECVTLDKPLVLGVYMGLIPNGKGGDAEKLREMDMLASYYSWGWDGTAGLGLSNGAERRIALLRPAFLGALLTRGGEVDGEIETAYLARGEWNGGEELAEYLVSSKVPGWPILQAMKEKVQASGGEQGALAVRAREVAQAYDKGLGKVWDDESAGESVVGVWRWKVESARKAVSAWLDEDFL